MSEFTFTESTIPENAGPSRTTPNRFLQQAAWCAKQRDKALSFLVPVDPKDPTTFSVKPQENKELGKILRELGDAGAPAKVTIRKRVDVEFTGTGKSQKPSGIRVTFWAVDKRAYTPRQPKPTEQAAAQEAEQAPAQESQDN